MPELSAKERAARLKALPEEDRKWVEEYVAPIILPDEKNLFLQLTEPHQREIFREEFWKRREQPGLPEPLGPGYRNRYEGFREAAAELVRGPDERPRPSRGAPRRAADGRRSSRDCTDVFRDLAVWSYRDTGRRAASLQKETQFLFYRGSSGRARGGSGIPAIPDRELLAPASCLQSVPQACRPIGSPPSSRRRLRCRWRGRQDLRRTRATWSRIIERIRARGVADIALALSQPPKVDTEGLDKLAERFATLKGDKAKALTVEGPSRRGPRGRRRRSLVALGEGHGGPGGPGGGRVRAGARPARSSRRSEMQERTEALPQKYRDFLTSSS